ncbi:MAG: hypothetical protein JWR25_787, partial [Noviherbaspirillum sp.]|nr:hypothetical protein [Noviherbaspirillum sp.]
MRPSSDSAQFRQDEAHAATQPDMERFDLRRFLD